VGCLAEEKGFVSGSPHRKEGEEIPMHQPLIKSGALKLQAMLLEVA